MRARKSTLPSGEGNRLSTMAKFLLFSLFCIGTLYNSPAFSAAEPSAAPAKPIGPRDTLTFTNGDTLSGKLDREVSGTVFFVSDELGAISVPWSKIKALHTQSGYVVLENKPGVHIRHFVADVARGTVAVQGDDIRVSPSKTNPVEPRQARREEDISIAKPIPVSNAQYILDERTFDRQVRENPRLYEGWNGNATAGVTLVQATENQYTYTSAVGLVRTVPTVTWLPTRNRSQVDFSSSYGKITQPAYVSGGVLTPAASTKTSIFHADAERDEYVASRLYGVLQTAFDHNYSQGLNQQDVFGFGLGVTAIRRTGQQLDLKGTLQYERQTFITAASGTNQELVGSTFSASYVLKLKKGVIFTQQLSYVPAYNIVRDYSANETDTLTFPAYKNLAFTVGTIDSYLNDPVTAEPPNARNSFQFTTGITYTVKSKY